MRGVCGLDDAASAFDLVLAMVVYPFFTEDIESEIRPFKIASLGIA